MGGIRLWKRKMCFARVWRVDTDKRAKEGHLFGTYIEATNISRILLALSHTITTANLYSKYYHTHPIFFLP